MFDIVTLAVVASVLALEAVATGAPTENKRAAQLAVQIETGGLLRVGALRDRGGDLAQLIECRIDRLRARRQQPAEIPGGDRA